MIFQYHGDRKNTKKSTWQKNRIDYHRVGSIVWSFRGPKKPRCRGMSARRYALDSVWPQLSFFSFSFGTEAAARRDPRSTAALDILHT